MFALHPYQLLLPAHEPPAVVVERYYGRIWSCAPGWNQEVGRHPIVRRTGKGDDPHFISIALHYGLHFDIERYRFRVV